MINCLVDNKVFYKIFDYSSPKLLNLRNMFKYNDDAEYQALQQNLTPLAQELTVDSIFVMKQIHGVDVIDVCDKTDINKMHRGDGVITNRKNIAIGIITADCVPVLLFDSEGDYVGAVHCGWKSAKQGIVEIIAQELKLRGAKNLKAVIGPAIRQRSYEVDAEFYRNFLEDDVGNKSLFLDSEREGRYMFDLVEYVYRKLQNQGVDVVSVCPDDTYSMSEKYPSFRRHTHENQPYDLNILSTIYIK